MTALLYTFAIATLVRTITQAPKHAVPVILKIDASNIPDDKLINLSYRARNANAVAIHLKASHHKASLLMSEQKEALGAFPGPCPVILEPLDQLNDAALLGADALVTTDVHHGMTDSVICIKRVETLDQLRAIKNTPEILSFSAHVWEQATEEAASFASQSILIADVTIDDNLAANARSMRAAGCDALVLELAEDVGPLESLISTMQSKRSTDFGSLGLKMGYGTFSSEQYWLNKDMKEILARKKKNENTL